MLRFFCLVKNIYRDKVRFFYLISFDNWLTHFKKDIFIFIKGDWI